MKLRAAILSPVIVALAAFTADPAAAQAGVGPGPSAAEVQQMGNWIRQMAAAQQPVIAAFERCKPAIGRVTAGLGDPETARALMPEMGQCLDTMESASTESALLLRQMPPLPASIRARTRIDTAEIHRRSAAMLETAVLGVREMRTAIEATAAGDAEAARAASVRARKHSAAAYDGQIIMAELSIKGTDRESTVGTSTIRLLIAQAMRALTGGDAGPDGVVVGTQLRDLAPRARAATAQIRRGWIAESAEARRLTARATDPRIKARMAQLDGVIRDLAAEGDALAQLFEQAPTGTSGWSDTTRIANRVSEIEIRMVQIAASVATILQKAN